MTNRPLVLVLILTVAALGGQTMASGAVPGEFPPPSSVEECARVAPLPPCQLWASRVPKGPANEVHIAVNPTDPLHLLAVGKDYSLGRNGDCASGGAYHVGSASYVSFDGGLTWSTTRVPAPYPNGGAEDSPLPFKCGSDPVAIFGPDGTAYYLLLNFQYTGGRAAGIAVARSLDGGRSWPAGEIRLLHTSGGDDKEWGASTRDGNLHIVWTDVYGGRMYYARTLGSFDQWQVRQFANSGSGNPAVTVAGGPNSEVYIFWRDGAAIKFTKSTDGGATLSPIRVAFTTRPYEASGQPRLPFMPQLAVDANPDSPFAGSIYVAWPQRNTGSDAFLAHSRDGGLTWSTPVRVNDDSSTSARQVMPHPSVAPNGRVDVAWVDQRLARNTDQWHAFVASSTDGGVTFGANRLVQDVPLEAQWSRHQNGGVFIGDYIGIASTNSYAYPIFPGNSIDRIPALGLDGWQRADAYTAPVAAGAPSSSADAEWRGPIESVVVGDAPLGVNAPENPPILD